MLFRSLLFSGTDTDSTLFRYSSGKFFGTRTDSTFPEYSPEFYHFAVLTLILPFQLLVRKVSRYSYGFFLFLVVARILPFFATDTDSTLFQYSSGKFLGSRTDSTFSE